MTMFFALVNLNYKCDTHYLNNLCIIVDSYRSLIRNHNSDIIQNDSPSMLTSFFQ